MLEGLERYKIPLALALTGLIFIVIGIISFRSASVAPVQILDSTSASSLPPQTITVDIGGAVEQPGLYTLPVGSKVEDVLKLAGGFSETADVAYISKNLNRAARLSDGSKLYIPNIGEEVAKSLETIFNINTASLADLDNLAGVGLITADKIIGGRPYQRIEELLERKIVNQSTWEKIRDKISVN